MLQKAHLRGKRDHKGFQDWAYPPEHKRGKQVGADLPVLCLSTWPCGILQDFGVKDQATDFCNSFKTNVWNKNNVLK